MKQLKAIRHSSAFSFLERVGDTLVRAEAENVLLLGIAGELVARASSGGEGSGSDGAHLFTVESESGVVMAALQTPPFRLVVSSGPGPAVNTLVEMLLGERLPLPGVNGPVETARAFAETWTARTGQAIKPGLSLRVHRLTGVVTPPEPPGEFRQAGPAELPTLVDWIGDFRAETGVDDPREVSSIAEAGVAAGRFYVWDDRGPVSMAGWSGATPSGVRVNGVYTPPEGRARGYASACVASLIQLLMDRGRSFCALFTDLANPISNRLYRRIGYDPVCDFREYGFLEGGGTG